MADYHVFCDESHTDDHQYRVQGGIWANNAGMRVIRDELKAIRDRHPKAREFKWAEVHGERPYYAYADLVALFFDSPAARFLSFNCIVVQKRDDGSRALGAGGRDIGFYKTYFTLFKFRCLPDCRYHIRLDQKTGPRANPEQDVGDYLNKQVSEWNPPSKILSCRGICSKTEDLIQLADLLCGAVGWDWNGRKSVSHAKVILANQILVGIGRESLAVETSGAEKKFNIWRYRPKTK